MSENTTSRQLTLFAVDFLASLTVLLGSERARQMTATSGLKCIASFGNSNRLSSLLKTCLASRAPFSTRVYLTWKVKDTGTIGIDGEGTESRRWLFQLARLMPRMSGIDSSLWPTLTRADASGHAQTALDRTPGQTGGTTLAGAVRMWPTMTAGTGATGKLRTKEAVNKSGGYKGRLEDAVVMWPTPTANRRSGLQSHGKNAILGHLNPQWVEWLMGFPIGWTDLEPLATP